MTLGTIYYNSRMFFMHKKIRGYTQDLQVTTHPISGVVANTEQAGTIFDGITYSKGAATLKQLCNVIGIESFREGLKEYFATYAYKNSELRDLLECLQKQTTLDLEVWKQQWICTPGHNTVEIIAGDDSVREVVFGDANSTFAQSRMQKINVAFIKEDGELAGVKEVYSTGEPVKIDTTDVEPFFAIIPNYNDLSFIHIKFDTISLEFFLESAATVKDIAARGQIYQAVFLMSLSNELDSSRFLDFFKKAFALETEVILRI